MTRRPVLALGLALAAAPLAEAQYLVHQTINGGYGHTYWALVSSTDTAGGLDVWCGMRESGQTDPYVGGNSIAGVSAGPGGYTVKPTIDLAFDIQLADSVLTLANAATNSTSGLFIGATNAGLPFFGGTLVPSPDVLILVPTGPTGGFLLPGLFPAGLPAGIPLHFQVWVLDPTAPQGHAASNAVTATTG